MNVLEEDAHHLLDGIVQERDAVVFHLEEEHHHQFVHLLSVERMVKKEDLIKIRKHENEKPKKEKEDLNLSQNLHHNKNNSNNKIHSSNLNHSPCIHHHHHLE